MQRPEGSFPATKDPLSIKRARVWNCKYSALAPIATLENLEVLVLLSYPDTTFAPIAKLRSLRYLSVTHFPQSYRSRPVSLAEESRDAIVIVIAELGCIRESAESRFAGTRREAQSFEAH